MEGSPSTGREVTQKEKFTLWVGTHFAVTARGSAATPEHVQGPFIIEGESFTAAQIAQASLDLARESESELTAASDEEVAAFLLAKLGLDSPAPVTERASPETQGQEGKE